MTKQSTSTLSRCLQATAILAFAFGLWRLWRYLTFPLADPEYMLFTIIAATVVGVGILCFDEMAKIGGQYVGWAFLFGVGVLAFHLGFLFMIFPEMSLTHPIYLIPTRSFGLFILSAIIIIESILVQRVAVPSSYKLERQTLLPILYKVTAMFVVAWGTFLVIWEVDNLLATVPLRTISPLILGSAALTVGIFGVLWVEIQKRQASFRRRKLPILFSFIFIVVAPTTMGLYLWAAETLLYPVTFFLPIHVLLGIALIIQSIFIFYYPSRAR
ncbi:MAG: hypothetical protein ACFFCO_04375 [Promethearchaeota archaeon]